MKNIRFNPCEQVHKAPVGAVEIKEEILLSIHITLDYVIDHLRCVIKDDKNRVVDTISLLQVGRDETHRFYQGVFRLEKAGLYWYHFAFNDVYGTHFIGANHNLDGVLTDYSPVSWQLLIHHPFPSELPWYKGKVMYQIMVDRFYSSGENPKKENIMFHEDWNSLPIYYPTDGKVRNNDFFGGDIKGIIQKLPYLASLHVGVLYLNPIFEAASNHKYDTGDYMKIDPMFGSEEDFIELCKRAEEFGIAIILDGVFNHTGDDSLYFNKYNHYHSLGAYQSKESPFYTWFLFVKHPTDYLSWWNFDTLPSVNQNNENYLQFITGDGGVIDKWLRLGAKGFRLDVVDELTDGFVERIASRLKQVNKDNILIGEVWEDASTKIAYGHRKRYLHGLQLDSVMNYPMKNAIIEYLKTGNEMIFIRQIRHLINNYPKHVLDSLMNPLGTHDTTRIQNQFYHVNAEHMSKDEQAKYVPSETERKQAIEKVKIAAALQYTIPGVPSLYYGDEIGMDGFKDPLCRKTMKWDQPNVELFTWYQMLGEVRKNNVFTDGIFQEEYANNGILVFSRRKDTKKVVTIVNLSNHDYAYHFKEGYDYTRNQKTTGRVHVARKSVRIIDVYK